MPTPHKADEVTFFEDRARVERVCMVTLPAGAHVIDLEGVSAALVDRSLVARCETLRVVDATVRRQWRIGADEREGAAADITRAFEALRDEAENLMLQQGLRATERAREEQHLQLVIEGLNQELPYAPAFPAASRDAISNAWSTLRALTVEERKLYRQRLDIAERYEALRARALQLAHPHTYLVTTLSLHVHVEKEGSHEVRVAYTLPCALWRPMHRVSLTGDSLRFECAGAVWQSTGEEWTDVRVRCSTARSTQRAEPPVLSDDWLQTRERQTKQVVATFIEQSIQTTGDGVGSDDVPGVDDGGESRLLEAAARVNIPSNGRMQRIPLFSFETKASASRVCRPELSPVVFIRAEITNTSKYPLLAGPLELLRNGGNVGVGTIPFIAPGEKSVIDFGADDAVRVIRVPREKRETAKLTGKLTIRRDVDLYLSHLDDKEVSFSLEERVPVSELKEVDVNIDAKDCKPVASADDDGIVRYAVTLGPNASAQYTLAYTVVASSDVRGL